MSKLKSKNMQKLHKCIFEVIPKIYILTQQSFKILINSFYKKKTNQNNKQIE